MGPLNPTGSKDGYNVEIYSVCLVNAGMVITAKLKLIIESERGKRVWSGHLTEGAGEAWAGQLRL